VRRRDGAQHDQKHANPAETKRGRARTAFFFLAQREEDRTRKGVIFFFLLVKSAFLCSSKLSSEVVKINFREKIKFRLHHYFLARMIHPRNQKGK
jgi:hypothetical protein